MAGASMSALPILVMFVLFQRRIIQGLTAGALKE
jgi:ABC-type maltose transport system permease subunit